MRDERPLTLRQIDQARGDLYGIADDLEFIKEQLARLPTRKEMAQTALLVTLTTAALVLAGLRRSSDDDRDATCGFSGGDGCCDLCPGAG